MAHRTAQRLSYDLAGEDHRCHVLFQGMFVLPVVALIACGSTASRGAEFPQPNIVLIISDDQAWTDYSFMAHPIVRTPHIDRLARNSATFRRGYVPTALCRPSLMTLATGLYTWQHKTSGNDPSPSLAPRNSPAYAQLRAQLIAHIDRHPTVPKLLGEVGYLSHQSGKWWEGGYQRGGFTHGMSRGFPHPGGRHGDDGLAIGRKGMQPIFDFIDHAVSEEKPFFLWYAPFLPHTPHNPPERLLKKYQDQVDSLHVAKYYAMCEWFDETCGELMDHVEKRELTDNTLFVYVTDNGWIQRKDRGGYAPRSKQSANEGGTRTPIMLSWRGVIEPAERGEAVSSVDLAPTILSAAGATIPDDLSGVDLMPVLRDGKPLEREAIFGEGCAHDIADLERPEASLLYRWCIEGKWKLLLTYDGAVNRYKSSHPRAEKRPQLFDLMDDPHENRNLAGEFPEVVARLVARIDRWYPVKERQALKVFQ